MTPNEAAKKLTEPRPVVSSGDRKASAGWRQDRNERKRARKVIRSAGGKAA